MVSSPTEWQPNRWIAATLSFFVEPAGMLYVQRPGWALTYWLAKVILQGAAILGLLLGLMSAWMVLPVLVAAWIVTLICMIHAWRLAKVATLPERKWYSRWPTLTALAVSILLSVFLFRAFLYEPFRISSDSMYPTLARGSIVLVSKWGYGHYSSYGITSLETEATGSVARGDIIVFNLMSAPKTRYVMRVMGLPGDRIRYVGKRLEINGVPVSIRLGEMEDDLQLAVESVDGRDITIALTSTRPARDIEIVVEPDHYLVLGDSRDNSRDSRYIGLVPARNIVGTVRKTISIE